MTSNEIVSRSTDAVHRVATAKAMRHLLPVICAIYFMAYIDRTNVALAKTELHADIGISAAAFGMGAGVFFLSYALLEIPSNLIMYRVGPRRWITRIAVTWGMLSALMMFVEGETSFYIMRFLLGAAEAGLFPALMYLVTLWFAQEDRATVVGLIYLAPTTALIIGGPLGGALMELDSAFGLHGWQWMFMIEGIMTVVVGVVVWFKLCDNPTEARFLTADQAQSLTTRAVGPHPESLEQLRGTARRAFGRPFVLVVAFIYFLNQVVNVGIVFNIPSIVESLDIGSPLLVGIVSGSAGIGATVGVLLVPRIFNHFRRHEAAAVGVLAAATAVTAVAYLVSTAAVLQIVLIAISMVFVFGTLPLFWSIATARMSGLVAAAGLAFINTVGLIGGFAGPYLFGLAETATGDPAAGLYMVVAASLLIVLLTPLLGYAIRREDHSLRANSALVPSTHR
jgi:sugar phosphate permease